MAQLEIKRSIDVVGTPAPIATETQKVSQKDTHVQDDGVTATCVELPPYLDSALEDAERLLKYAADVGIDVEDGVRRSVLQARTRRHGWSGDTADSLLIALTKLTERLRPVTAESLRSCSNEERHAVRGYWRVAVCLATIIVPFSFASFVTTGISDAIRKDIATANELTVKITSQLHVQSAPGDVATSTNAALVKRESGPAPGVSAVEIVTELQQFATIIRAVDGRARRLNVFMLHLERDPFVDIRNNKDEFQRVFQLPWELQDQLRQATQEKIRAYQDVRYFAQSLLDDVSTFYGAITVCLLPVLYACLGTCAYLLRSFEEQMRAKTFIPSVANSARFLIAGIGGAVVGLFNNFNITQGASIPPLALAFLLGYAVDVFFSFLEGLLQAFTKPKSGASPLASLPLSGRKA